MKYFIITLLKETLQHWSHDRVSRMAAAVAYYTIFSLAPIMIISIKISGVVFGPDIVQDQLIEQIHHLIGAAGADQINLLLKLVNRPEKNLIETIIGPIILILAAVGLLTELQDGMNTIWNVKPRSRNFIWEIIQHRILSFAMILAIGFLLLVSLIINVILTELSGHINKFITGGYILTSIINFIVSLGGITCLFALLFKILPDINIRWRDVWLGAFITSLLFTLGKTLIATYIGNSNLGSFYGASSSFIIVLIWIYYSSQILFIGAEFIKVYVKHIHGSTPAVPTYAKKIKNENQ
jgi:membrane protein